MVKNNELRSMVEFLWKEACDCYNATLPKTPETTDDSWYYEGRRNSYREILDVIDGNKDTISSIRERQAEKLGGDIFFDIDRCIPFDASVYFGTPEAYTGDTDKFSLYTRAGHKIVGIYYTTNNLNRWKVVLKTTHGKTITRYPENDGTYKWWPSWDLFMMPKTTTTDDSKNA